MTKEIRQRNKERTVKRRTKTNSKQGGKNKEVKKL